MVETRGFEPRTPCLQSRCSSQLSYVPVSDNYLIMVGLPGLEPGTSSLSVTRSNQLSYSPAKQGLLYRNKAL
jgi:hypothetical protein